MSIWAVTTTVHSDSYPYIDPLKADLKGKSVFVTGASRGIGRSIAIAFAVAGCSRIGVAARGSLAGVEADIISAAVAARGTKPEILLINMDLVSEESVKEAAVTVSQMFGGVLDVLVNNAGDSESPSKIGDMKADTSEWWKTMEVNIRGIYLTCHHFLPIILNSNSKTIINLTSGAAAVLSGLASAYGTSKLAACRLTEFLDVLYCKEGLVSYALEPGAVQTDLAEKLHPDFRGYLTDKAELAAHTAVWLVGNGGKWLSSRYISSKWDMEELEKRKEEIVEKDLFTFRLTL
ncbi:NAD(P)-binding protein [Thozetella sp. PMI_491]|nr:NAD(P)-binding protein [Thozetella sp. PMI_491]